MQNSTTLSGAQPEQGQTRATCRLLRPREITSDPEFRFRHIATDKGHVRGLIEKIAARIREAVGKMPWQDEEIAAEAIQLAIGTAKLRAMAEWLFFDDEFGGCETGSFAGNLREPDMAPDDCDF